MARLTLTVDALQALEQWSRQNTGRDLAWPASTLPGGRYAIEIGHDLADMLDRFRFPGESDEALMFRMVNSPPGSVRPQ